MNPAVSVLTAVYDANPDYLRAAYESLRGQKVTWEWVIQVDGPAEDMVNISEEILADRRVRASANGRQLGTPTTRNAGLVRCAAPFVQNLDGDDALLPGALEHLAQGLIDEPETVFAFGRDVETYPDGTREAYQGGLAPGTIPPEAIYERWTRMPFPPVHPAGILWRKAPLFAYGGWTALRSGEDTALVVAASLHHPVVFIDRETLMYRRHTLQFSQSPEFRAWDRVKREFIHQRVAALKRSGALWDGPAPSVSWHPAGAGAGGGAEASSDS